MSELRAHGLNGLVLVGALLLASHAFADFRSDYIRGENAAANGDWAKVEQFMNAARAQRAEPSRSIPLVGNRVRPYIPRYYLGLAAAKTQRCQQALSTWDGTTEDLVLTLDEFAATFRSAKAECQRQVAGASPAVPPPVPEPIPQPPAPEPPPALVSQPPVSEPVRVPEPEPVVVAPPPPAGPPPAPPALRSALRAYLAGQLEQVLATSPESVPAGRPRAELHGLRAAAMYLRAQQSSNPSAGEQRARREFAAARAAWPNFQASTVLYSPTLISFSNRR